MPNTPQNCTRTLQEPKQKNQDHSVRKQHRFSMDSSSSSHAHTLSPFRVIHHPHTATHTLLVTSRGRSVRRVLIPALNTLTLDADYKSFSLDSVTTPTKTASHTHTLSLSITHTHTHTHTQSSAHHTPP